MSVLDVFISRDDASKGDKPAKASSAKPSTSTPPSASSSRKTSPPSSEKFTKHFQNLLDTANLPGPDYYEFQQMMESLAEDVPDESKRIRAVFKSLKPQGLTKSILQTSAATYVKVIEKDKKAFEDAVTAKINEDVGQRKKQLTQLESDIEDAQKRITELTAQIKADKDTASKLSSDIEDAEADLNASHEAYTNAADEFITRIQDDSEKIKTLEG